jgi:hypothetical protein
MVSFLTNIYDHDRDKVALYTRPVNNDLMNHTFATSIHAGWPNALLPFPFYR